MNTTDANKDNSFVPKEPRCGHKGNWRGIGQSLIAKPDSVIIVASSVCGECGDVDMSLNTIRMQSPNPPQSNIVVPKLDIQPKKI